MEVNHYRLLEPGDLFLTLTSGKKFSTLVLSQAYLQLLLDEELSNLVTVNTHRGLNQYLRLPFSVACSSDLLDTVLQGIPNVIIMLH